MEKQLTKRFKEVYLDGKWIANTNFKEQLADVNWEEATTKIGSLNTIAALTFHVNYYIAGILNVFEGGNLEIKDKYSFDMPPVESKSDWDTICWALLENAENFAKKLDELSETQLDSVFVKAEYGTYRRNIEGVIEHSYYHLGQISLIKKMVKA